MKAPFLISEILKVEKSLAGEMIWLGTKCQQTFPVFSVGVVNGNFGFVMNHKKPIFQKWEHVSASTDMF